MSYAGFLSYAQKTDASLAEVVQRALHQLARKWYKIRALRIFRDKSGLSANAMLWPSISSALDGSRFYILLASPAAATSFWVNKEAEYWLSRHGMETVLIALTEGTAPWDAALQRCPADAPLPPAVRDRTTEEPLYVDLRWARGEKNLSLRHGHFRDCVLDLAAPLHGRSKDDLDGYDVRQHRRFRIAAGSAMGTIVLLAVAAAWFGVAAVRQSVEAQRQRASAEQWAERRLFTTSVLLEGQVEGGRLFATIVPNTDHAGLTFGMRQWAQRPGRLGELLRRMQAAQPALFVETFADGDAQLSAQLVAHVSQGGGGVTPSGQSTDPRFELWKEPWLGRFTRCAADARFQAVQLDLAFEEFRQSMRFLATAAPEVRTERGLAFMLDVATQFGDGGARRLIQQARAPGLTERGLMQRVGDRSVKRMPDQFAAFTLRRRTIFLETPLLLDEPVREAPTGGQERWSERVLRRFTTALNKAGLVESLPQPKK
jgi:hypothetical protein